MLQLQDRLDIAKKLCTNHFLIPFEGEGPTDSKGNFLAYLDPIGIPTIAWGFTRDENNKKINLGDMWTRQRAVRHKNKLLDDTLADIFYFSPSLMYQSPRRIAAVLSWVYNLGIGNYNQSTFKKKIDKQEWEDAYYECRKWNRAGGVVLKGLTRRREAEGVVILLDSFGSTDVEDYD